MKIDLYTKAVLTVIAIALVGILVKDINFVSKAQAEPLPAEIFSTKTEGVIDVNIVQMNGKTLGDSDGVPVKVKNRGSSEEFPVNVQNTVFVYK